MKKKIVAIVLVILLAAIAYFVFNVYTVKQINSFAECAKRYPVLTSYPAQCNTPDGRHFVEPIETPTPTVTQAGLANPASVNCERLGGSLEIKTDANGGQVGYCTLPNKKVCEEWALFRGECK